MEWFTGALLLLYTVTPNLTQIILIQRQDANKNNKCRWCKI